MRFLYFLFENETKPGFEKGPHADDHEHEQHIGKDKVAVYFHHGEKHHYHVGFEVNDSHSHSKHEPLQHLKILHHVSNKVHEFITHHKPKGLHFRASDVNEKKRDKKHKVYGHIVKNIAHVHKGKYRYKEEHEHHSIHWD